MSMNESSVRSIVRPVLFLTLVGVALEIILATFYQPVFSLPSSVLALAWLLGLLIGTGWIGVHRLEHGRLGVPGFPLLLAGAVVLLHLAWVLGWNHPGTYVPLVGPFLLAAFTEPDSPPASHREFRWLTVVAVSLVGTGSWKAFHVWRYGAQGPPWREVLFFAGLYGLLRYGPVPYRWLRRGLPPARRTGLLLALVFALGASLYWFLQQPVDDFEPYFDGRLPGVEAAAGDPRPNIIMITPDTLRWDHVPGNGEFSLSTPALESLREDSLGFPSLFSTSGWTLPAYASLFSGLLPEQHGAVVEANSRIYAAVPHYTQHLRQMGYATAGFTDGVLVRKELGFSRGFDRYWEHPLPYRGYLPGVVEKIHAVFPGLAPGFHYHPAIRSLGTKADIPSLRSFSTNVDRAKRWIRRRAEEPFFLFLHTYQVHDWNRFYPESVRRLKASHPRLARMLLDPHTPSDPGANSGWRSRALLYDYGVEATDTAVGNFLSFLKEQGLYRDSVIVFFSDHGEGFNQGSSARFHGRGQLQEVLIRVPMWMKLPGNRLGGKSYPGLLQITDVFPMILEAVGREPPFLPRDYPAGVPDSLAGDPVDGRTLVRGSIKSTRGPNPRFFVRSRRYKLTRDLGRDTRRFYRVDPDGPRERVVFASSVPDTSRRRLGRAMDELVERHRRGPDPYRHHNVTIEDRVRQELRGMGYLQ